MVVGYQIGEQGANHRDWLKIVQTTDAQGRAVLQTNSAYVELATGLNYKDPTTGKWLPSKEEIDGYPGGAIAQYGQHKVIFANDLNTTGAIDLRMPDGNEMKSEVVGLSYYDPASGKSVLIAEVQDSQGQIVNSTAAFYTPGQVSVTFNNVLFSESGPAFTLGIATVKAYSCTFDLWGSYAPLLIPTYGAPQYGQHANLFNCILANVQSYSANTPLITGDHNGFYNSGAGSQGQYGGTMFGTSPIPADGPPFQNVAGGHYYLATNPDGTDASGFRGKGTTTDVDPALLVDLKSKTTYPPDAYENATISSDNLNSQVPRDNETPGPDLGYHYSPLDYVFHNCQVDSGITFPAGTAVGWQGQGLTFSGNDTINFNGIAISPSALNPCYFVRCNAVQESDQSGDGIGIAGAGFWPTLNATFARFSAVGDLASFFDANSLYAHVYNSEFWNGLLGGAVNGGLQLSCYNCLLDRGALDFQTAGSSPSSGLTLQSCTVHGGSLQLNSGLSSVYIRDCAFDNTDLSGVDSSYTGEGKYDAYIFGADYLPGSDPGGNPYSDIFVNGNFNWQNGPLGDFYLPDNPLAQDGSLLID